MTERLRAILTFPFRWAYWRYANLRWGPDELEDTYGEDPLGGSWS